MSSSTSSKNGEFRLHKPVDSTGPPQCKPAESDHDRETCSLTSDSIYNVMFTILNATFLTHGSEE